MYLVCISVTCRLLVTMGEFSVVTDDCHMELSRLQSAIKMINVIIPAAVRKRLLVILHLQHLHVRYSLLARTPYLCLQT